MAVPSGGYFPDRVPGRLSASEPIRPGNAVCAADRCGPRKKYIRGLRYIAAYECP